eukprot:764228-Hanusia_phi.AAC.3
MGFKYVAAGPMVRSSYKAGETCASLSCLAYLPLPPFVSCCSLTTRAGEFFLENMIRTANEEEAQKLLGKLLLLPRGDEQYKEDGMCEETKEEEMNARWS